jgi:hypothetical protein
MGQAAIDGTKAALTAMLNQYQADSTQMNLDLAASDPRYTSTLLVGPVYMAQLHLAAEGLDAGVDVMSAGHGVENIDPVLADRIHEILTAADREDQWKFEQLLELFKGLLAQPAEPSLTDDVVE